MRLLPSLLVAADFRSTSDRVLDAARRLARAFGSRVHLMHVIDVESDTAVLDYFRRQVGQLMIEPVMESLQKDGIDVGPPTVVSGSVADRIVRHADDVQADLVIVGGGEIRPDGAIAPGPIAEAVAQHARRPVLVVHPAAGGPEFKRIVCPIDGSPTSLRGLRNAVRLSQVFSSHLTVVTVIPEVGWLAASAEAGAFTDVHEKHAALWRREIETALARFDFGGVAWTLDVRSGSAAGQIVGAAIESNADLIVQGATGRSGVARLLLGGVTRRVFRQSPCSLLVVHDSDLIAETIDAEELQRSRSQFAAAVAALAAGDHPEALRRFDSVLAVNPFHAAALDGRAQACEGLGDYDRAARCRRRAEALRNEA